jgi:tRNA-2-methylthio-N6-dimethylallyladenosine synthase
MEEKDYGSYFTKPSLKDAVKRSKTPTVINKEGLQLDGKYRLGEGKSYFIRTFGCQANLRDEETIAGILEQMGYTKASDIKKSDIIILNTCAVRENAEERVFGEVGHLKAIKSKNPDVIFAISGCMVQQESIVEEILKKAPHIDLIFGTHNLNRLPELIYSAYMSKERVVEVFSKEGEVYENLPVTRNDKLKAWVNIMFGCDKFCTYCIVPYTRGKERSRLKEDIIAEVIDLKNQGYKEITLLGQNVNAYGKDLNLGYSFADLLVECAKTGIERIRFTTSHPWNFTDEMIDAIATYDNIMSHIHLPIQSGSDEILRRMARRYTYEEYRELYFKLRNRVKNCSITTDIIVGFPQETEEQFQKTLDAVTELQYDSAFTFIYSPRVGTPAAKMVDDVAPEVKKERFNRLVAVVTKSAKARNEAYVGKTLKVLVEGQSKRNADVLSGYSEENKLVNFIGDDKYIGQIVNVKITKAKSWTLEGEMIER